ncbi:SMP-30/gluconolactonase/LRE family protein [Mycobacterium sp. 141]|uniref:SMP-30/gluconolactonase/LRE family protein n=1 Tax=Mycobacterium sp. 141 TaxID=1120797 RepID=UPI0003744A23|nr:SMP-30/gluconolactonase/LRE family protein [Mycobacterium sp. 141]
MVVTDARGPEGPLFIDGKLYYLQWVSGTLSVWDGQKSMVLNDTADCGHNGLALTKQNTFFVTCSHDPGAILELDKTGKVLRSWDTDGTGQKFAGGLNDVVIAADGGAYATAFGPALATPTSVAGKLFYLPPGGSNWTKVADDLNYANGVGISPDQKTLYVSQTVSNSILQFNIGKDGTLSDRADFAVLSSLTDSGSRSPWLGPDSMKVDGEGNVFVAQWFGGKVLKLSPKGELLHEFDIPEGDGTTNIAFSPDATDLYVTVVKDANDPDAKGSIVKIKNVQ